MCGVCPSLKVEKIRESLSKIFSSLGTYEVSIECDRLFEVFDGRLQIAFDEQRTAAIHVANVQLVFQIISPFLLHKPGSNLNGLGIVSDGVVQFP